MIVNNLGSRNVLVIEPMGAGGELLLISVKRKGYRAVVATTPDVYRDSLQAVKHLIDELIYVDFADPERAVDELIASNTLYDFAGVVVAWEFLTEVAAKVAAALGLRGPDLEHARARRNKHAMASVWEAASCPVPRLLATIDPEDGTIPLPLTVEYPLVIKPAENSASFGVTVVRDADRLQSAVDEAGAWTHEFPHGLPFDRTVLVQEYLPGQEFSVEAVTDRGRFFTWGVTMKFTTGGAARAETGHLFPAPIPDELAARIIEVARQGTSALGITDGISHTEIKLDVDGNPRLIESGPRPAGDFIPRLVELATGESPTDYYVVQAVCGLPDDFTTAAPYRSAAVHFVRPLRDGILRSVTLPKKLGETEVVESRVTAGPGQEVTVGSTNVDRVGWMIFTAADGHTVKRALDEVDDKTEMTFA